MTIYVTPFMATDRDPTAASVDSGFETLDQVVEAMGPPTISYPAMVIYGEGEERVVFSRAVFRIDGPGINA